MSTENALLSNEVAALVHHVELNRAGWWDKAVHRLILAAIWMSDSSPNKNEIHQKLQGTFRLSLSAPKLSSALSVLESQSMLIHLPGDLYKIPEKQRLLFEKEIEESTKVADQAREHFFKLVVDSGISLDPQTVWNTFELQLLGPLIKNVGANAYRLIAGERMSADQNIIDSFTKNFPAELHSKLNEIVTKFLDPKKDEVRAYVSRMLHARFCVEAGGLPESVIQKLNTNRGKQIRFRVFVDTNFLFSLLEIHENPSNEAARELRGLILQLNGNPKIELFITHRTIEEAKGSISATKFQLSGFPSGNNFTQAASHLGFSGMAERFLSERLRRGGTLSPEEWFAPYLNDFIAVARGKGVELYNEKLDAYPTRRDVVDDISMVMKFEESLPPERRKSYPKVSHDMILWHFVNDKRAAYIESPLDAQDWILTVDFRLIGFDEHKQKLSKSKVPLCLHPTSLIQLLQFWVPRTKEFEEAVLGSLRLPFLFQEFDVEAERTSLKILKGLGRFHGGNDIPQETITQVVLNDGLRSRLKAEQSEETEIALIRDALLEEMKARADAEARKALQLEIAIKEREAAVAALTTAKTATEDENAALKRKTVDDQSLVIAAKQQLIDKDAAFAELKSQMDLMAGAEKARQANERQDNLRKHKRFALLSYLGFLAIVLGLSALATWKGPRLFPWYVDIMGYEPTQGLMGIAGFLLGHLLLEFWANADPVRRELWPFLQLQKFRKFLWTLVILSFVVGVVGNLYANRVQKNLDERYKTPSPTSIGPARFNPNQTN